MSDYFDPEILNLPSEASRSTTTTVRRETSSVQRLLLPTVPVLLVSSVAFAMTMPVAERVEAATPNQGDSDDEDGSGVRYTAASGTSASVSALGASSDTSLAATAPSTYIVAKGDTVSSIAGRYGLSTAKVLAWNGLSWSSLIFPGQKLSLSAPGSTAVAPVASAPSTPGAETPAPVSAAGGSYVVAKGDTISGIAARHGVSTASVLAANGLGWKSLIFPGQKLTIPGTTAPAGSEPVTSAPVADAPAAPEADAPAAEAPAAAPAPEAPATAPATPSAPVSQPQLCQSVSYIITTGDSIGKIAGKFGVTSQSILDANGLSWNSMIYAGRTLTIPSPTKLVDNCVVYAELTPEMRANAQTIVNVGRAAGVSDYGLVIALATAAQESGLINISYGDADSVGLFQQRTSTGWGTIAQIMDPTYSAKAFFGGPVNPNPGKTRGLLDIPGWQNMSVTQAAQAVQISAFPDAYAKWESSARHWLTQLN